jgi:cytochrome P450
MDADALITDDQLYSMENYGEASGQIQIDDPYPVWAELLAKAPVHKGTLAECMGYPPEKSGMLYIPGMTYYSVFSYAACSDIFTRKDDFGSEFYVDIGIPQRFGETILDMDGLRHRRYRDLIQPFFQPTVAEEWWRPKFIAPLVDEIITSFEAQPSVDLNGRLFAVLPMHTVTAGFGLARADAVPFRRYMHRVFDYDCTLEEATECMQGAGRILERVVGERRREPQDDLISKLAHADLEEEGGGTRKLTVEEIVSYCRLIVFAGGETTWRQLGIAMFALLSNPDQLRQVIADRSLLRNAILESTRWNPDPLFPRKVRRDTVLQGVELPAGAVLHVCLGAANRDPSRWEDPDRYDIRRPIQRSVAFAAGHHSCLGQHVARQEIETALNALFDRFPNIRWDPSQPPAKLTGNLIQRGPGPLPVLLH